MSAWKDTLMEAGLEPNDNYWVEGTWSAASGALAIEKLFDQYPDMDAIFIANDQMALGAMQFFAEKKISIPQDIGIVGFDNISESAFFFPALTTVQQDQHKIAKIAVTQVIKIIESGWQGLDPVDPPSIIVPPTLIVRQSSLRVPKGGEEQRSIS
jgi:LacI family transcriptional regulator